MFRAPASRPSWPAPGPASASPPRLRPGAGEIGMCQRPALIAVEKNNVARFGLLFAQLQAQAHPFHFAFRMTSLQRVPGPPPAELFSQGLGQLRTAGAHALARFDPGAKAGDRPVAPVGHRFFQQGGYDAQGGFTLHRRRARRELVSALRHRRRCRSATGEPYLRARQTPRRSWSWSNQPASKGRRAPGPPRRDHVNRQEPEAGALFIARRNRRLSRHAIHLANRRRQRTAKNLSVG